MARYCLKFRDIRLDKLAMTMVNNKSSGKFFVNVCTCEELPGPVDDLDEVQVAAILDSANSDIYRIPISIGAVEFVADNRGEKSAKVEVMVNSTFYDHRIAKSAFFEHLFHVLGCDMIETKYGIRLDVDKAVRLQNKRAMGEVASQRIRKRPFNGTTTGMGMGPVIEEVVEGCSNETAMDVDVTMADEEDDSTNPNRHIKKEYKNYQMWIRNGGEQLEIRVDLPSTIFQGDSQSLDVDRLSLEMNDDHINVTLDHSTCLLDIFVPVKMDYEKADCELNVRNAEMVITVPIALMQ